MSASYNPARASAPRSPVDPYRLLLEELSADAPSAIDKRRAAWAGLDEQTQMELLLAMSAGQRALPVDLLELAATSANGFVRYLAARAHRLIDLDDASQREAFAKLDADRLQLVAFARYENSWTWAHADPVGAPQPQRLAMLRGSKPPSAEQFAVFILQAMAAAVPEVELLGCLLEYSRNPATGESTAAGDLAAGTMPSRFWAMRPLWQLMGRLPPRLDRELARCLPAPATAAEERAFAEAIVTLDDRRQANLLIRDDLRLTALRRAILSSDRERDEALVAVAASNLELDDRTFGEILMQRPARAVWLSRSRTLAPVQLAAIYGYFTAHPESQQRPASTWALAALKERIARSPASERAAMRAQLRLLELARRAVPWNGSTPPADDWGELAFLRNALVPGDTWETYRAFARLLPPQSAVERLIGRELDKPAGEAKAGPASPPLAAQAMGPATAGAEQIPAEAVTREEPATQEPMEEQAAAGGERPGALPAATPAAAIPETAIPEMAMAVVPTEAGAIVEPQLLAVLMVDTVPDLSGAPPTLPGAGAQLGGPVAPGAEGRATEAPVDEAPATAMLADGPGHAEPVAAGTGPDSGLPADDSPDVEVIEITAPREDFGLNSVQGVASYAVNVNPMPGRRRGRGAKTKGMVDQIAEKARPRNIGAPSRAAPPDPPTLPGGPVRPRR